MAGKFESIPNAVLAVARVSPNGPMFLGTAFFVGRNLLATAAHVTGSDDTNLILVLPNIGSLYDYQDTGVQQVRFSAAHVHAVDPFRDIALLAVDGSATPNYGLLGTDDVVPGSPVTTFGFPHADTGRWILTQHDSQVGARILLESEGIKSKHLVLNTQARPGQSGGPVFSAERGSVVAMIIGSYAPGGGGGVIIAGIDPASLNQTTHAVSAEYIREML